MDILISLTIVFGVLMSFGYFAQTYKIVKRKNAADVSIWAYLLFSLGIIVWLIYGVSINSLPIIVSNIVYLIGALSVMVSYVSNPH